MKFKLKSFDSAICWFYFIGSDNCKPSLIILQVVSRSINDLSQVLPTRMLVFAHIWQHASPCQIIPFEKLDKTPLLSTHFPDL